MKTHFIFLVLCLLLTPIVTACTTTAVDQPARFSFSPYGMNEKSPEELNRLLRTHDTREGIEKLLITEGGARKENFGTPTDFYIYESSSPLFRWAVITAVAYDEQDKPVTRRAVRDNIPLLVSPVDNPGRFRIQPWATYGGGYGKARLDSILKEAFPPDTSCATLHSQLQASGDMNKVKRQKAYDPAHEHVTIYKSIILMVVGWEYGVSFSCDAAGLLRTPPRSFGRYTGV
jgi:hypothetical protein